MTGHRVAVLALDRVIPLDLAIPVQVFGAVSGLPYRLTVCGTRHEMRTTAGFRIRVDAGLGALRYADTVVVPGWEPHDRPLPDAVSTALQRAHRRGARLVSICVGAFALAAAGLLDGRPATTHWQHVAQLAASYPAVDVRSEVLYVDDGDVLTSAGVSAGMDLCLHIVRRDLGVDVARRVARAVVAAPHREGNQAQFVARPGPVDGADPIGELRRSVLAEPAAPFTLRSMAERCHVSTRTLSRHFRDIAGTTPLQWVTSVRVDTARHLLESTDLSVDEIAARSGFGTAQILRNAFRRHLATTPTAYRHAFGDRTV